MKITIVGPASIYPERKNVEVGDKLSCKKVLSAEYGKTVEVHNSEGVQIGFIAANESTAIDKTSLAEEIFDAKSLGDDFVVTVSEVTKNGRSTVFVADVEEEGKEEEKTPMAAEKVEGKVEGKKKGRSFSCEVVGNKKVYPYRYEPVKKIRSHETVPVKLQLDADSDVMLVCMNVEGEWRACGHINAEKNASYMSYKEVCSLLEMYKQEGEEMPEYDAVLTELNTAAQSPLSIIMECTVYGQTALEAATESLKETSGMDESAFDEMRTWLESLNISEQAVKKTIEMVSENAGQDATRIPVKTVFNNYDEVTEDILYSVISNANTMLVGPMAAGKNTCIEAIAYYFKKALYEIQVNSYIDNDTLLGTRTIVAKESAEEREKINAEANKLIRAIAMAGRPELKKTIENGSVEEQVGAVEEIENETAIDFSLLINAMKNGETEISFQPSALIVAMEKGSWITIDEFNTGQPSVMAVLNSVLDDRKRIQVPGYGLVKAAPGFRIFATMNPEYEGTFALNPATASRFNHVWFRASDKISPIITSRVPKVSKDFLTASEKIYKHIRNSIDSGKMQEESINVRGFIEAARMCVNGRGIKKSLQTCVAGGVTEKDDRTAIKDFVEINIM